jgi:AcrR family transcriptional regulator
MGRSPIKKEALERAALELFVTRGVDGTSVREISLRAGVTEGALYRHHPSKDDLVRHLFFRHYAGFAKIIKQHCGERAGFREAITAIVQAFYEFHDEDPLIFNFVMMVQHRLLDEVRADSNNPVELLSRMVRAAIEAGEIPQQDPELVTQLLLGLVLQVVVGHHYGRIPGPLARLAPTVAAYCIRVCESAGQLEAERSPAM